MGLMGADFGTDRHSSLILIVCMSFYSKKNRFNSTGLARSLSSSELSSIGGMVNMLSFVKCFNL